MVSWKDISVPKVQNATLKAPIIKMGIKTITPKCMPNQMPVRRETTVIIATGSELALIVLQCIHSKLNLHAINETLIRDWRRNGLYASCFLVGNPWRSVDVDPVGYNQQSVAASQTSLGVFL
jgi:hypothetical protein